jgi:hypothetical protein
MPLLLRPLAEKVQSDRVVDIGRIKVRNVLDPPPRNVLKDIRGKITVRIYDSDSVAGLDILKDEITQ